jgi:hypothetical protein
MPVIAVLAVVRLSDVPIASSIALIFPQLGGAIALAVAQAVFLNRMLPEIQGLNPDLTSKDIMAAGATGLKGLVTESQLPLTLKAYAGSLDGTFKVAAAFSVVGVIVAFGIEWKSIKKDGFHT